MTSTAPPESEGHHEKPHAELREGLERLAREDGPHGWHLGARLRNYFLTGLVVVGPVTLTLYIAWYFINVADNWVKPYIPDVYNPSTYIGRDVPGVGLIFAIIGLTLIGALAANLIGRSLISTGELMVGRMPIVRNVYRALKQIFESVVTATSTTESFQKVGVIEFPSKGLWSIVFVTGETTGEIQSVSPGGNTDLLTVFMPTGIVPPTGFICFVPRADVTFLQMNVEDAAKIIISGGMVMPEQQAKLKKLAEAAKAVQKAPAATAGTAPGPAAPPARPDLKLAADPPGGAGSAPGKRPPRMKG